MIEVIVILGKFIFWLLLAFGAGCVCVWLDDITVEDVWRWWRGRKKVR